MLLLLLVLKGRGLALKVKHHAEERDLALAQRGDKGRGNRLLLRAGSCEQGLREAALLP